MDQKNRKKITVAEAVSAVLLIGIFLCMSACGGYDRTGVSKLYDSGDGYLSESDHEEAAAKTVSEALMGYFAEIEPVQTEETEEITEARFPIQEEENPEDENVVTETELDTITEETLGSSTVTGAESETVTDRGGEEGLFAAVPAFDFSNITIMGYDLLRPHIGEVAAALGHSNGTEELPGGGHIYVSDDNIALDALSDDQSYFTSVFIYSHDNFERDYCYLQLRKLNGKETYESQLGESWCNIPISLGDSYGWWCEQVGLNTLKNSPLTSNEKNEWIDTYGNSGESYSYYFQPEGRNARINYIEYKYTNAAWYGEWFAYDTQVDFFIEREDGRAFRMDAFFLNETVQSITYYVYP